MRLADYLRSELVVPGLDAADMEGTIHVLARHLADQGAVQDGAEVSRALLNQERLHTTVLGRGVAIPHASVPSVDAMLLLVAVAPHEIQYGPPGSDPCKVFFLLLSPPGQETEHIKLLARLSRLVRHPGFVEALFAADSAERILDAIREVDSQHV